MAAVVNVIEDKMEEAQKLEVSQEEINEITKYNHVEGIQELVDKIKTADFVALDVTVETTGFLMKNEEFNEVYVKDVQDYFGTWYDKIKDNESTHCLLEVGIAVFNRDPNSPTEVQTEVYNIPVLPACVDDNEVGRFRGHCGVRIVIDGYGQEFMTSAGFDINKPLYWGAPYLNRNLCKIADDYIKENPTFMVSSSSRREIPPYRKRSMNLNPCWLPNLYEFVGHEERKEVIERFRGVSKVFEELSTAGIPIVGHNLLLKMMFIYKDFLEYLPDTYPEYFDKMTSMFKLIYDTKQMPQVIKDIANVPAEFSNGLSEHKLYNLLRNLNQDFRKAAKVDVFEVNVGARARSYMEDAVDLCMGDEAERYKDSYCYVAGFDALVSGLVFLDLICILQVSEIKSTKPVPESPESTEGTSASAASDEALGDDASGGNGEDHYDMLMKGSLAQFKNKLYGEPAVPAPSKRGELFQTMTEEKRRMRKRIEAERRNVVRATIIEGVRALS